MSTTHDVWTDPELRDLALSQPELLAVADALSSAPGVDARAGKGRRFDVGRLAAAAAALAAVAVVALIAPWGRSGRDGLNSLALAAIGSQPVLHVVAEETFPPTAELIDIASGQARPVSEEQQLEIWYDADQGLKHTITRSGSTLIDDVLETPAGGFSPGGIVYDCAWIAAHPVEATKARVSCNANMDNGTTPHVIPRPKPTLDQALAGFLDGYRNALADGTARDAGPGRLDGHPVVWLEFPLAEGGSERAALDTTTHKPLLIENSAGQRMRITSIETVGTDDANFTRPSKDELGDQPSYGGPVPRTRQDLPLDPAAMAEALPGAVWAGPTSSGLALASAERMVMRTSFADDTRPRQLAAGLSLVYSANPDDIGAVSVHLDESRTPQFGYSWGFVRGDSPAEGTIYAPIFESGSDTAMGFTVVHGIYVTLRASSRELLLAAVRALRPAA